MFHFQTTGGRRKDAGKRERYLNLPCWGLAQLLHSAGLSRSGALHTQPSVMGYGLPSGGANNIMFALDACFGGVN